MAGDETLAIVVHELQEVGFLPGVESDLTVAQEKDGVHIGEAGTAARRLPRGCERVVRNDIGIGAYPGVVKAGFVADAFDSCQSVSYGIMLGDSVPGIGPGKDGFPSRAGSAAAGAARRLREQPDGAQRKCCENCYASSPAGTHRNSFGL